MLFGSRPNKLASGVRRLLTDGAVGSAEPGFNVDFLSNEYRAAGSSQSLATALTHSRSGNATMTDSDGLLKWAPHNLLTYSEDFSNGVWTKTNEGVGVVPVVTANAGAAPDGTNTADRVQFNLNGGTASGDVSRLRGSVNNAPPVTGKFWVKSNDGSSYTIGFNLGGSLLSVDVTSEWQLIDNEWLATGNIALDIQLRGGQSPANSDTADILIWGTHLYRSDLGGMVDNPERGDSYVPTTSAAAYLPRIGHHEFNGYEWVNKGLLAESEARTNLITYSQDFTDASWIKNGTTIAANSVASPDGTQSASTLDAAGTGLNAIYISLAHTAEPLTFSIYAKAGTKSVLQVDSAVLGGGAGRANFDLSAGVLGTVDSAWTASIVDVGNGWYRCVASFTGAGGTGNFIVSMQDSPTAAREASSTAGDLYLYGGQFEAGSVPSSYVPTSGATATRAAETFTVPAANLPWPQPEYIGPELVTNGGFDTDTDWTKGTGWTISGGKASCDGTNGQTILQTSPGLEDGAVYRLELTVSNHVFGNIRPYVGGNNSDLLAIPGDGTYSTLTVAGSANDFIGFQSSASDFSIDNVSIREVNPLSVSIAMKGEMDYADTGDTELTWYYWFANSGNYVQSNLRAQSTATGELYTLQAADSVADDADGRYSQYAPGLNVPFDIAARHGSTFVNGAAGGVALTADTTPTALPDLSATDLDLASDFMGTIESFRVWDQDLGDSGIEEASAPSLEPSLNLTFDGSGLSFTDTGWTP